MKKVIYTLAGIFIFFGFAYSQDYSKKGQLDAADRLLAFNFKVFYSVDTELGWCMAPIIEERVISELKDSNSFNYPYDSLSKYIKIIVSEDSLLRTFSWDKRSGGSWHDMASYAQYKTDSGYIRYLQLDSGDEGGTGEPTDVIIYKVHTIEIENKAHYLLLGWGTYGGGKHHSLARIYKIEGDALSLCDAIFNGQKYLYVGVNRIDKIELEYNPELKTLSYNYYEPDEKSGFYNMEAIKVKWILKGKEFVKIE